MAILALHGAIGYVLMAPELWRVLSRKPMPEKITWLVLAPQQLEQSKPPATRESVGPPRAIKRQFAAPRVQPIAPVPVTPQRDTDLSALRSYVWCGALDDGKKWNGEHRNCDNVHWGLQTAALPKRAPTEVEKDLTRKFEHELAFDKAPKLIPCLNGGLNIICLVQGAMNGFDYKMASYGDLKSAKTACASRFDGEACARIYSLNSTSPTAVQR